MLGARLSKTELLERAGIETQSGEGGAPVTRWARDVDGFDEDHTSILAAPLVYRRLDDILDAEMPPQEEEEE